MVRGRIVTRDAMPPSRRDKDNDNIKFFELLDRRSTSFSLPDPGNLETRSDRSIPFCGCMAILVCTAGKREQEVSLAEGNRHSMYSGPSASLDSSLKLPETLRVETSVHLYAFRLVGDSKHWPDALDSAGISGCAFLYASTATGKHDTPCRSRTLIKGQLARRKASEPMTAQAQLPARRSCRE